MAGSGFGWQIIQVATGIAPKKLNYPLAKSSTFTVNQLVGVTNANYAGGPGYLLPINGVQSGAAPNAANIRYAVGMFLGSTPGTNGAFTSTSQAGIYTPVVTPGTTDGLDSANVATGAAKLLPDTSAPTGYTNCSTATDGQTVYTIDGQSGVCFLGVGGPAAALTAGYVPVGPQIEFNPDGDNNVVVECQPWVNSNTPVLIQGVVVVAAGANTSTVLAGAQVGDQVFTALDITAGGTDVTFATTGAFEASISVAGHIKQIAASGSDGITTSDKIYVVLQRVGL